MKKFNFKIKKKPLGEKRKSEPKQNTLIQAAFGTIGEKYINHSLNCIVEIVSMDTKDSSNIADWKLQFKGKHQNGDNLEFDSSGLMPLVLAEPDLIKKITFGWQKGREIELWKINQSLRRNNNDEKNSGKKADEKSGSKKDSEKARGKKSFKIKKFTFKKRRN